MICRRVSVALVLATALGGLSACTRMPPASDRAASAEADRRYLADIGLQHWTAENVRLFLVSSRVLDAALQTGLCKGARPVTGLLLDSELGLPAQLREEVVQLGLQSGPPRVLAVVPGGPAAEAGLMPGDQLVATAAGSAMQPTHLTVRRGDTELGVTFDSRLACDYTVQLEPDAGVSAYGYFSSIHVTYGQIKAFPDDAMLAFVIGHEVGHFVAGHQLLRSGVLGSTLAIDLALTKGLLTAGSQLALRPVWRKEELEADRIGLRLALRAGYDRARILAAWPTYAAVAPDRIQRGWWNDHPGMAERYTALSTVLNATPQDARQPE